MELQMRENRDFVFTVADGIVQPCLKNNQKLVLILYPLCSAFQLVIMFIEFTKDHDSR